MSFLKSLFSAVSHDYLEIGRNGTVNEVHAAFGHLDKLINQGPRNEESPKMRNEEKIRTNLGKLFNGALETFQKGRPENLQTFMQQIFDGADDYSADAYGPKFVYRRYTRQEFLKKLSGELTPPQLQQALEKVPLDARMTAVQKNTRPHRHP